MKKLPRIGVQKKHGARSACRDGGVFEKTSASSLASAFSKQLRHSCNESALGFSGQQTGSSSSVLIREIRGFHSVAHPLCGFPCFFALCARWFEFGTLLSGYKSNSTRFLKLWRIGYWDTIFISNSFKGVLSKSWILKVCKVLQRLPGSFRLYWRIFTIKK